MARTVASTVRAQSQARRRESPHFERRHGHINGLYRYCFQKQMRRAGLAETSWVGPFCATVDTIHDSYECFTEGRTKARLAPGMKDLSVLSF